MMFLVRNTTVTLNIFYWMPDYQNILQQFIWQTTDVRPEYPRVHRFLNYWHNNIEAVIEEINISDNYKTSYK